MSASNNKKEAFGGFNSIEERDAAGYQAEGEDAVSLGELEEAEDFFYKALDLRLKIYGPDEPKTGDSFYSLGDVQRKLGRLHEAAGHTQEAIDILSIEGGVKAALARESMGRILEALGLHGPAKEIRLRGYPDYMSCGCVSVSIAHKCRVTRTHMVIFSVKPGFLSLKSSNSAQGAR